MDSTLCPSDKSHITFADTGKSKVLGLGRVAISKNQHMDKVMLVESLGFNLMSVSITEPKKVEEAFMEPEWIKAMQEELQQLS